MIAKGPSIRSLNNTSKFYLQTKSSIIWQFTIYIYIKRQHFYGCRDKYILVFIEIKSLSWWKAVLYDRVEIWTKFGHICTMNTGFKARKKPGFKPQSFTDVNGSMKNKGFVWKDLKSQFLILQSEKDPHATEKRNPSFWCGKARDSFWTVACTCTTNERGTTLFITPGAQKLHLNLWVLATSPSLYLYGMLKDPGRADRLAGLPPACPARWITSSLAALSKRTPAHSVQLKYILLKVQIYDQPI